MSSAQGRFTSPDPKSFPHDITDPQSWNKYTYTRNNPLQYVDPDGEDWQTFKDNMVGAWRSTVSALRTSASALGFGYTAAGSALSENPGFSFSRITYEDLNNIGKNVTLGLATGEIGAVPEAGIVTESASTTAATASNTVVAPMNDAPPAVGETVFRLWGGDAGPYGRSWTPINPETVPNYRGSAGLPNVNTGTQMTTGTLTNADGVIVRPAKPLDGNPGGLKEYVVPDPKKQIEIKSIKLKDNQPFN